MFIAHPSRTVFLKPDMVLQKADFEGETLVMGSSIQFKNAAETGFIVEYGTPERATEVMESMFEAMKHGNTVFFLPEK